MKNKGISSQQYEFYRKLMEYTNYVSQEDSWLCLLIGKIVRDRIWEHIDIIEEIIAKNPERIKRHRFISNKFHSGRKYRYNFYSMAEAAKILFEDGPSYLAEKYFCVFKTEKVLSGQMLYCLSCCRRPEYKDMFRQISDSKTDKYNMNNAIYALAYMGDRRDYDSIVNHISGPYTITIWRPYYRAPMHVAFQWADGERAKEILHNKYKMYTGSVNYKQLLRLLKEAMDLCDGKKASIPHPIYNQKLPAGLPTPSILFDLELE